MGALPSVLGCSFDRLRTGSPCDVLFKYASGPTPCGCPVALPPRLARMAGRHTLIHGLATAIPEICGLEHIAEGNSDLGYVLTETLRELSAAARSIRLTNRRIDLLIVGNTLRSV
jgi:hypothetical protein